MTHPDPAAAAADSAVPTTTGSPVEISLRAPAKVNLRLVVLAREESGFHQLETVFCALRFADLLVVRARPDADATLASDGIHLHVSGPELGLPEANLVHRAAVSFFREAGLQPIAEIRLVKRVPASAGLGGGSSDAAATLRALNRIHGGALSEDALLRIGAELGSDVPFFLCGAPRALGWGRGERLLPLGPLPAAPVLVVCPSFGSPTPAAYSLLAEHRAVEPLSRPAPAVYPDGAGTGWDEVARAAVNDFEAALFPRFPELRAIRDAMCAHGAVIALLAGSGSAVFGVFPDADARRRAGAALRREFGDARIVQTWTVSG